MLGKNLGPSKNWSFYSDYFSPTTLALKTLLVLFPKRIELELKFLPGFKCIGRLIKSGEIMLIPFHIIGHIPLTIGFSPIRNS